MVTYQGAPYRAATARAAYEDLGMEYVPTKEGTPTQNATLERSFGVVKQVLTSVIFITSALAAAVPALTHPSLAKTVGKYLVAAVLDAHRLGRESSLKATARPQDRQAIERLVEGVTDRSICHRLRHARIGPKPLSVRMSCAQVVPRLPLGAGDYVGSDAGHELAA